MPQYIQCNVGVSWWTDQALNILYYCGTGFQAQSRFCTAASSSVDGVTSPSYLTVIVVRGKTPLSDTHQT